ncbi:hypothetical protein [Flavivirga eckloniae]|uniref:Uncharacterized protein n=1 Tax=Flavivirga eckloniae TaxID=1803846 RepID=A0A2K9PK86_9FLAO|nr:hypothetical protein [Flavivirga eckloniae]AUP77445.1 hypothetical protein C1H87_01400 [Flavivirga eckloniae]
MELGKILDFRDIGSEEYGIRYQITIIEKDGSEILFQLNKEDFVGLESETINPGDTVFYENPSKNVYRVIALNSLKAQYSDSLDIADKLTGKEYLEVHIDPGTATSEEIASYLIELKKLYMMMGGSGITYNPDNVKVLEKSY